MIYDLLMRLPLLGLVVFDTFVQIKTLQHMASPFSSVYVVHVAMRLSTIIFLLLVAAVVILRSRPSRKATGLEPRISALLGSFMTYGIVLFPPREISLSLEMTSTVLILIGTAGAVVALSQLGRSFSIMAETRQLVTSGPYRLMRHPLYLTEGIAVVGIFIQFASACTALLVVVQFAFQLRRMHHEEMVLAARFPEYRFYQRCTARLIPGVY